MQEQNTYCRLINYPKFTNSNFEFEEENFLNFVRTPKKGKKLESRFVLSVIIKSIGEARVHEFGIKVAAEQSADLKQKMGDDYTEKNV